MGPFLSLLDVVNVSLSTLAAALHSSLTTIQWATSGYLLALALMLPLNGWLVERMRCSMPTQNWPEPRLGPP
jgi:MFS family permease